MKTFILCVLALFLGVGAIAQVKKDSITAADFHVKKKHWDPFAFKKEASPQSQNAEGFRMFSIYQRLRMRLDNNEITENEFQNGLMQLVTNNMRLYIQSRFFFRPIMANPLGGILLTLSDSY